jgi:hypothetical protein
MLVSAITSYVEMELASFIRKQRKKARYDDTMMINGFTFQELEARASRIALNELSSIFEKFFDHQDIGDFWLELQVGVYKIRTKAIE